LNIPKQVKIGGKVYEVKITDDEIIRRDLRGEIDYFQLFINIAKSHISESGQKEVLIHEVVHGMFDFMGWMQDEERVSLLASALYALIVDNPEMFETVRNG
jgi:hypothetical protein